MAYADVDQNLSIMMNFPPKLVGPLSMPLVKTKHGLKIFVTLPLVKDWDNSDLNINAVMRNNSNISLRVEKVPPTSGPSLPGQPIFDMYVVMSNTLKYPEIDVGIHLVDVEFKDAETGIIGVKLSFKVEVLSLAAYLRQGLDTDIWQNKAYIGGIDLDFFSLNNLEGLVPGLNGECSSFDDAEDNSTG